MRLISSVTTLPSRQDAVAAYLDAALSQPVMIEQIGLNVVGVCAALPPRYIRYTRSPAHKGRTIA